MISLSLDSAQITAEMDSFLANVKQITSPSVLEEISKAIFTVTGENFVKAADRYARMNPKKMHHVYEWGKIGEPTGRLFTLERISVLNGSLLINTNFLPSKMPVPINPELLLPGPTGKIVTRRSIFSDKAKVMEEGQSVTFTAQRILSFVGDNGLVFIKPGTQVNILTPGGRGVKGSFSEFLLQWYTENGYSILENSGLYERISNDVSAALSSSRASINTVKMAVAGAVVSMGLDQEVIV
jgi:hypothetical protein